MQPKRMIVVQGGINRNLLAQGLECIQDFCICVPFHEGLGQPHDPLNKRKFDHKSLRQKILTSFTFVTDPAAMVSKATATRPLLISIATTIGQCATNSTSAPSSTGPPS